MYAGNNAAERARWQVLWVSRGQVKRKDFEHDLSGALTFHLWASANAGTSTHITLRCCNVAFPPPVKFQPHAKEVKVKGQRKPVTVTVQPMRGLNRKGIFWCPYCMKMRRFVKRKNFEVEGIKIVRPVLCCPLCEVSHREGGVQRHNPFAGEIALREDSRTRKPATAKDDDDE